MTASFLPRALGRAAAAAVLALGALAAARPAAAQTLTAAFSPVCEGTACSTLRFGIFNPGASTLTFATLGLAATGATFTFAPVDAADPTVGEVTGFDASDPQFAPTVIGAGGTSLLATFDAGFPFVLPGGTNGFLDVEVLPQGAGAPTLSGVGFTFSATFAGQTAPVTGTVAVVPEPATVALVAGGVAVLAAAARRRRAA